MSKELIYVVKVGGKVIENPNYLDVFLDAFSKLNGKKILVHGGGKMASQLAKQMGIKVNMVEGRRITDDEMQKVVVMVYGGLANKQLVGKLQKRGVNALGVSGADGNIILSEKRPIIDGIDFGWVGDPVKVDHQVITQWVLNGMVPVIAPLTHDGKGNILNTNADTIANVVATSLTDHFSVNLVYTFELPGVMKDKNDPATLIHSLDHTLYQDLKEKGDISEGMIPKLDNAFHAINKDVSSVHIINYTTLHLLNNSDFSEYTYIH